MNGNIMSDIGLVSLTHIYSVSFVIKLISQMLALVLLHFTVVELKEFYNDRTRIYTTLYS